jgi:hypothetical protein
MISAKKRRWEEEREKVQIREHSKRPTAKHLEGHGGEDAKNQASAASDGCTICTIF